MEVSKMEGGKNGINLTSPAAFVEGGLQESCEDSCSICLEEFCDNDPKTVTCCKHEFHFQCILEWCQRSLNCPICWQAVSLKDPSSQELLEAVMKEKRVRHNPTRNSTIFHHPTLGDFEIRNVPVGFSGSELENRIAQHLAAATAAMGRAHLMSQRNRVSVGPSQHGATISVFGGPVQEQAEPAAGTVQHLTTSGTVNGSNSQQVTSVTHSVESSEIQAALDTWKSRFSAFSTRYKESLSKSTRVWKDKLFNKSQSVSNIGSEVRREDNTGIDNISRMTERLDVRQNSRQNHNCVETASGSN